MPNENGKNGDVCAVINEFAQKIDQNCRIAAVVRVRNDILIKIRPGDSETGSCLRLLYALRLRFPFSSVTAVEDHTQQRVFVQMLLHEQAEECRIAKEHVRSMLVMRLLKSMSSLLFFSSCVSFLCMLHASTVTHHTAPL